MTALRSPPSSAEPGFAETRNSPPPFAPSSWARRSSLAPLCPPLPLPLPIPLRRRAPRHFHPLLGFQRQAAASSAASALLNPGHPQGLSTGALGRRSGAQRRPGMGKGEGQGEGVGGGRVGGERGQVQLEVSGREEAAPEAPGSGEEGPPGRSRREREGEEAVEDVAALRSARRLTAVPCGLAAPQRALPVPLRPAAPQSALSVPSWPAALESTLCSPPACGPRKQRPVEKSLLRRAGKSLYRGPSSRPLQQKSLTLFASRRRSERCARGTPRQAARAPSPLQRAPMSRPLCSLVRDQTATLGPVSSRKGSLGSELARPQEPTARSCPLAPAGVTHSRASEAKRETSESHDVRYTTRYSHAPRQVTIRDARIVRDRTSYRAAIK